MKSSLYLTLILVLLLVACNSTFDIGIEHSPAAGATAVIPASSSPSTLQPSGTVPLPSSISPTSTPDLTLTPTFIPTLNPMIRCIEPPEGLVGWWPAEGNAEDIRYANHGVLVDGASYAAGLIGEAFNFNGNGRVISPTSDLPTGDSDRTLALWVKVNDFFDGAAFFSGYGTFGTSEQSYRLSVADKTIFFSQGDVALFGPALQTGRWYYVAVTNVGSTVTLYLDGEAVASGDARINTSRGTQLFIGSLPNEPYERLNGLVDEVEIYDRALSNEEILSIFTAGYRGKCTLPPTTCTLSAGQAVHAGENAVLWSQPDVTVATLISGLTIGQPLYVLSGPVEGPLLKDGSEKGAFWEVSLTLGGPSAGWVRQTRIRGCSECYCSETLFVPFTGDDPSAQSSNSYKGMVWVIIAGEGQSNGNVYNDAFYIYTDEYGNPVEPYYPGDWMIINDHPALGLIPNNRLPPYQSDHVYPFTINAPGGTLTFGISDGFTGDNSGYYSVFVCQP